MINLSIIKILQILLILFLIFQFIKSHNKKTNKISIAIFIDKLKGGGTERVISILANELSKITNFKVILFTGPVEDEEFLIGSKIRRLIAYSKKYYLYYEYIKEIFKNVNIDIIIYNRFFANQIQFLLTLKKKLILIFHFQYFQFYYNAKNHFNYRSFDIFKYSDLMITLIPDDLFFWKKRGIKNVIYLPNLLTYNLTTITQSRLTNKNILMIGRGDDVDKHFNIGIIAMAKIIKEIPDAKLIIVSSFEGIESLFMLRNKLGLEKYVYFVEYTKNPEIYYQNSSIFLLPSRAEGFPMSLIEAKAFGIPNIVTGKKYLPLIQEGTIKIEEDDIEGIATESIKLLSNYTYRLLEGEKARKSLEKFDNAITIKKWKDIINSIYNQENSIRNIVKNENKMYNESKSIAIMKHEFYILTKNVNNYNCRKFEDLLDSLNKSNLQFC